MQIYIIMYSPATILQIVEDRRKELGLSQAEVSARAFGRNDNAAIQNLKKGASPSIDRVEALARALNLEVYFGPKRHASGFSDGDMASDLGRAEALRAGYLPIPWHDRARRNGSSPVSFAREWMSDHDLAPDTLAAVQVERSTIGLPMRGELLVVVDRAASRNAAPGPWAYLVAGKVHLSDIEFRPTVTIIHRYGEDGSTWLLFDTERDQITPLGRAVWIGGLTT